MIKVQSCISLEDFKKSCNTDRLDIYMSKKSGKKYACFPDGSYIGMLDENLDKTNKIYIVTFINTDTGVTWKYITNNCQGTESILNNKIINNSANETEESTIDYDCYDDWSSNIFFQENSTFVCRYTLLSKFSFGKYKGKTLKEVAEIQPRYIYYCIISLPHFFIDEKTIIEIKNLSPSFFLSSKIKLLLAEREEKLELQILSENSRQNDEYDYNDYYDDGDWGGLYGDEAEAGYWNTD